MSKSKFWQVKNYVNADSEILLYGPIASEHSWLGDEVTAKDFADDLESMNGEPITVRINSGGGDVFAAHAIHNLLAAYKGKVTVVIDGLCASAATIVAMAGDKVIMPANALFMIHNPMIGLSDFYQAAELVKVTAALEKIRDSIVAGYRKRCKASVEQLEAMMDAETWLSADECLAQGFVDAIEGEIDAVLDNNKLVVNSAAYDIGGFKNLASLKNHIKTKETKAMTKLDLILNKLGLLDEVDAEKAVNALQAAEHEQAVQQAVAAERARINELQAVDTEGNAAVAAIISAAVKDGKSVKDIQAYIDAVKNVPQTKAQSFVADLLKDNAESGVDKLEALPDEQAENNKEADVKAMADMVAAMNKYGGKK